MAKPSTKQGLIDYCFRKLGSPVLEINVDDDQVDDLVDDTIQYYNERHYNGIEISVPLALVPLIVLTLEFTVVLVPGVMTLKYGVNALN